VGTVNVTVRFNEEELRRLDELAQRMGKTRSDVVRDLINKFDEVLKGEVEKERKRWMMIGFVSALESAILDPELVLRFVRRNVDVLGYPDFLVGMVKVRNRVLLFSHHDKIGHQLLQQVRSKVEDEVKREEMEMEQEDGEGEEVNVGKATPMHVRIRGPIKPGTPHATPGTPRYKVIISNKSAAAIPKPVAPTTVGRPVNNDGRGGAKAAGAATVLENQKPAGTGLPAASKPTSLQTRNPNSQVAANSGGPSPAGPVGQIPMDRPAGDFAFALVANLYHKHRENLLRLIESMAGG
jgi:Arc/MetJ-type ribon-helix-helix transcriptional regulator